MYWLGGLFVLTFVVPNTTNFKERKAFSDERRLEAAMTLYPVDNVADCVTVVPGAYYERGKFWTIFLGKKQRDLWATPVKVKVFHYRKEKGGLTPYEIGGGQQTISVRLTGNEDKHWALRSVNKDQKTALPAFFRITFMRFLIRDQVAAINPYAQLVIPEIAERIGVRFNTPELVLVPYDTAYKKYNTVMAGRLAYLEQHLNTSWKSTPRYGNALDILSTEEMIEMQKQEPIPVDTMLYLRTRLFDILISDWDRHEGNWEWALVKEENEKVFEPIPKDRDMAFYKFDEGLVSHLALLFTNKLQSFNKDYGKISGLVKQSRMQDTQILSRLNEKDFVDTAKDIQRKLSPDAVENAFRQYPPEIYAKVGKQHTAILQSRLAKLPEAASAFHRFLH